MKYWTVLSAIACVFLTWGSALDKQWYGTLNKSKINPPDGLFPIVWPVLYLMIIVAGFKLLRSAPTAARNNALMCYNAQLLLNGLWSFLFFKNHLVTVALIDLVLMILFTAGCVFFGWRLGSRWLLPYLAWICFAFYLNYQICLLN